VWFTPDAVEGPDLSPFCRRHRQGGRGRLPFGGKPMERKLLAKRGAHSEFRLMCVCHNPLEL